MRRELTYVAFVAGGLGLVATPASAQHDHAAHEGQDAHAAAPAAGHDEHHGVNWTMMGITVWNFVVLLIVLTILGKKPLSEFLTSRRKGIAEALEEASRLKAEAERKHKEYSERLAKLDSEIDELKREMVKAGEAERDRIVAEAESKAARMRRDANFLIEQQMKQLRADLTREAVEAAVGAAREVLTKAVTDADQQRLAKDYVERVVTTKFSERAS